MPSPAAMLALISTAAASADPRDFSCPAVNKEALEAALQSLTAAQAEQWNTSFSTGIAYCDDTQAGAAAGLDDIFSRTPMTRDSLIPSGSVTKPWTAVAILQMVAEGVLALNTPAHAVVDPGLQLACTKGHPCPAATMLQLWNGDQQIQRITIKDLLGHTSGIQEYPGSLESDTLAGKEYNPIELIGITSKNLTCAAVPCPRYYSSINYVLLGIAMTHLRHKDNWADWDQLSVIPPSRRHLYNNTFFPKLGSCASYGNISHQYAVKPFENAANLAEIDFNFYDISDKSCLNGWTMGNIAASAMNLAQFFRDLFAPPNANAQLLPSQLVDQMRSGVGPLTNAWACPGEAPLPSFDCAHPHPECADVLAKVEGGAMCCGCRDPPPNYQPGVSWPGCPKKCLTTFAPAGSAAAACYGAVSCGTVCKTDKHCDLDYGLGMFSMDQYVKTVVPGTGDPSDAIYYGHGGQDYASGSGGICGFNPKYKFGFCVNYNSYSGMNCSLGEPWLAADTVALYSIMFTSCSLYSVALHAHGGPSLDCAKLFPPPPPPPYNCTNPPPDCKDALSPLNGGRICCNCVASQPDGGPNCPSACAVLASQHPDCTGVIACPDVCPHYTWNQTVFGMAGSSRHMSADRLQPAGETHAKLRKGKASAPPPTGAFAKCIWSNSTTDKQYICSFCDSTLVAGCRKCSGCLLNPKAPACKVCAPCLQTLDLCYAHYCW